MLPILNTDRFTRIGIQQNINYRVQNKYYNKLQLTSIHYGFFVFRDIEIITFLNSSEHYTNTVTGEF